MSVIRVKSLVKSANPVPERAAGVVRVPEEFAVPAASGPVRPPRGRRGLLVAGVACGAALAVGSVALFALQGPEELAGGGLMADEPYYGSTEELEGAADLIVRARLGDGREETADGFSETLATADVLATAKGDAPRRSITMAYTTPGSGPESAALTAGREYVFLLDRQDDGRFTLVNTTQGSYALKDGRAVAGDDNEVTLSAGVREALRLTG